ncbi:MAG TPA: SCP2 sterol-binding domain-containing protein [Stenotrophobium sp.]|jgi:ubiquinone biosynthesis protein UbiJ|nr:SCP2 sterol-binding domain-containing protein [Stenotrophobium sp.]
MSAPALLCAGLEVALNRYLGLSPEVMASCGTLAGRVIALHAQGPDWLFCIEFHGGGVRVLPGLDGGDADVTVSGPPTVLLRLAWKTAAGEGGVPAGLQVEGDTELLSRFNGLLAQVGFDPEELLAKFLGDVTAHRVNQGLEKLFGWGRQTAQTLSLDTAEYLREETRDLARGSDAEEWMHAVDLLRERVDRFEARLDALETQA